MRQSLHPDTLTRRLLCLFCAFVLHDEPTDNCQSSFVLHFCSLFFSQLLIGAVPLAKFLPTGTVPKPKPVCAQA